MKTIIIINRWKDDYADYVKLVDHFNNNIIYICDEDGSDYIKTRSDVPHTLYELERLDDVSVLISKVEEVVERYERVDCIVAMSEMDMVMSGILRTHFSIPGMSQSVAEAFTNKVLMKERLEQSGVRFPQFISSLDTLESLINRVDFPIVMKPHYGAGSVGVAIIKTRNELTRFLNTTDKLTNYEAEEYIDKPIVHLDGVVSDSKISFIKCFKYFGTCFEYTLGEPLGSILIDSNEDQTVLAEFAADVIKALGMENGVFHLEAFYEDGSPIFLEIGGRQGGGEVVPLMKHLFDVDLVECFFNSQIGVKNIITEKQSDLIAGFVLIPEPEHTPCTVTRVSSMENVTKTLAYEILPKVGSVLKGHGGYYFNSGRFLFKGNKIDVELDMRYVMQNFRIDVRDVVDEKENINN